MKKSFKIEVDTQADLWYAGMRAGGEKDQAEAAAG